MRPSRRELRRKPLRRRQIMAIRVTMLLAGSASAVLGTFNVGHSLGRVAAIALAVSLVSSAAGFTRCQLGQIIGTRPPADRVG
jgi:hypothetical protein